ncbi:YggT family protein [Thalassolituus marinus]|jgi:YggT family protein|uniref:YggT family protein n=1 Tax=Thalassolituus marinus TaxID=671053 RepID=A0ABS7ZKZ7_9GAMM|nr:YggT family protein [Thalassolituus marinus]MCA6062389.1 YggT family protein [Thalassolituus marinus]
MSPLSQVGLLLINTVGSMVLFIVMLRFLLQLVRADFYNPISQFVVKFTNPLLIPLRRVIPGFGGLDVAALVLAYGVQLLTMAAILLVAGASIPWANVFIWALVGILSLMVNIYFWGLIIVVIASWIAPNSYNPALILINQILEPVIRPIRAKMPDMGGLDLSPIAVFLLIQIVEILLLRPLAMMTQVPAGLIIGL